LKKHGYKVKVIYAGNSGIKLRGFHSTYYSLYLSLPIDIILHRFTIRNYRTSIKDYPKLLKLESILLFLNYVLFVLPKIYLSLKQYSIVIADRYLYDYIISRLLLERRWSKFSKILLQITPKPDVVIVLDADEKTAYIRKRGEKPLRELSILRRLYLKFSAKCGWYVINTSSISEVKVLSEILKILVNGTTFSRG